MRCITCNNAMGNGPETRCDECIVVTKYYRAGEAHAVREERDRAAAWLEEMARIERKDGRLREAECIFDAARAIRRGEHAEEGVKVA